MSQENIPIQDFISDINRGKYVIPHFQRPFDWGPGMVRDLLNSVLYKYYAGTVLLWRLSDSDRKKNMWNELWGAKISEKPEIAILDGQQRLSSLYYALCAPNIKFPNRDSYYYFFIDLEQMILGNEENTITYIYYPQWRKIDSFKVKRDELIQKGLFPLCLLSDREFLDSKIYQDWLTDYVESINYVDGNHKPTTISISKEIESILNFSFSTEILENKNAKEVCTIFANINSKGLKLSIFDLMNAFLYPSGIELRIEWDSLANHEVLKNVDSEMKVYILKLISLYKQRYCSSRYLYNLIPEAKIKDKQGKETTLVKDKDEFNKLWANSIKYSEKARDRIMESGYSKDFGAIKPKFIPNTTLIPVLGALWLWFDTDFGTQISEGEFWEKINKWYWCAIISGDYGGSSDSIMSQDYREVIEWLKDGSNIPDRVKKINNVFIEESLGLEKARNTNNSRYCAVLNLLALKSSRDWFTHRILNSYTPDKIDDHHIFPSACKVRKDPDLANSILNRTLLYEETNKKIRDKCQKEYCKGITGVKGELEIEEIMETHLISPAAFECMQENDFDEFIKERRNTICNELKKIIGLI